MEIKFRKKDLVKTMRRIDPVCKKLLGQLGKWVTQVPPPPQVAKGVNSSVLRVNWDPKHSPHW